MALIGSKKGYTKKDINFFAAFTESARKTAQLLAYVIIFALLILSIFIIWVVRDWIRNNSVQKDINALQVELSGEEYQNLEVEAAALRQQIADKQQYYYSLTEMRKTVASTTTAETELVDLLGDSIPNNSYVSSFDLTGNEFVIEGYSFTYYGVENLTYLLNEADTFKAPLNVSCERVALEVDPITDDEASLSNAIDAYYKFKIEGNLISDIYISLSRIANTDLGVEAISGIDTLEYTFNDPYTISGIANYSRNGVDYVLASVTIDGVGVTEDEFNVIVSNDRITGVALANTDIVLYYVQADAAAATTTEGGEEA